MKSVSMYVHWDSTINLQFFCDWGRTQMPSRYSIAFFTPCVTQKESNWLKPSHFFWHYLPPQWVTWIVYDLLASSKTIPFCLRILSTCVWNNRMDAWSKWTEAKRRPLRLKCVYSFMLLLWLLFSVNFCKSFYSTLFSAVPLTPVPLWTICKYSFLFSSTRTIGLSIFGWRVCMQIIYKNVTTGWSVTSMLNFTVIKNNR